MGLFSRRRNNSSATQPVADRAYPHVALADADWIRATGVQVLAGLGLQARPSADGTMLETTTDTSFGLDNAVAKCLAAPRETWRDVLEKHFGSVVRGLSGPTIGDLTPEQLDAQIRTRLVHVSAMVQGAVDLTYARPVTDELGLALCVDFPETVLYVDSTRAAELDQDAMFARGQRNTDTEPIDEAFLIDGTGVTVLQGESVFIASKIANMERLVQQVFGRPAPHGVIVAVPDRNTALLHLVESREAVTAIGELTRIAAEQFARGVGALTQTSYHWRDGRFSRLGSLDPTTGEIVIRPADDLTEILLSLQAS